MTDKELLKRAVSLAKTSPEKIGCATIITSNGEIIAETTNSQRTDNIAVHHAEVKATLAANRKTGMRKIPNAAAYCSCEPCAMCLTALSYAGIGKIVYHKSMKETFPDDPQSDLDAQNFVAGLNFVPTLIQLDL